MIEMILATLKWLAAQFNLLVALSVLNEVLTGHKRRDDLQSYARRHKKDKR
jgi:hypothetical protein